MDVTIETPRTLLEGTNYIYTESTNSEKLPVVCVHGIGSSHDTWTGLATVLHPAGYSVLAYDLMGRGDSRYPENNIFDAASHVDQLRKLITSLRINVDAEGKPRRYHMVAHSMGGAITAAYCALHGAEVQSTVLLAPAGLMSMAGPLWLIRNCCGCFRSFVKSALQSGQENAWRQDFVDPKGERANAQVARLSKLNARVPTHFEALWQCILQFPLGGLDKEVQQLAESNTSVFLIWGYMDKAVPFDNYTKWRRVLETANPDMEKSTKKTIQFQTFKELAHGLFLDSPEDFHDSIREFLDKCA